MYNKNEMKLKLSYDLGINNLCSSSENVLVSAGAEFGQSYKDCMYWMYFNASKKVKV